MLKTQTKPFHTSILLCTLVGNGFCGYQTHYFCNCTIVGNCKFGLPGGVSSWQDKHPPWGKISQRGVHIWWIGCICYQSWVLCNQPVYYKITMNKSFSNTSLSKCKAYSKQRQMFSWNTFHCQMAGKCSFENLTCCNLHRKDRFAFGCFYDFGMEEVLTLLFPRVCAISFESTTFCLQKAIQRFHTASAYFLARVESAFDNGVW